MDINILQFGDGNSVSLGFGVSSTKISGIEALIQVILIELLSDPRESTARGAGLATLLRQADPAGVKQTRTQIQQAVNTARSHVMSNQAGTANLTAQDRLKDMQLVSATQDGTLWDIRIKVTNQAGNTATISPSL